ncbi:MAG: hypothetical protein J7L47_07510 [Candidatus Odinarchaeota archaeon]|nr:hypothetical protein [Candidatus Odinarchaeota archaeon]
MSGNLNTKIPVFAIGYFGIVLSNEIKTSLFDFYTIPLNSRQRNMINEELNPKIIDFAKFDEIVQATVKNTKFVKVPLFIAADTLFNNFNKIFSLLDKYKSKIKSVFCVQIVNRNIEKEIKRILEIKPQDLDIMIIAFTGNEEKGIHKAKEFFETTDFILSSTGFINMSLGDFLTLGDVVFFSKYTATGIIEVQKQVIDNFNNRNSPLNLKKVKKIIIDFKAPTSITVAEVNDALQAIINRLSKDVDVQWGLFISDNDVIEVNVYFGLDKEIFLKKNNKK